MGLVHLLTWQAQEGLRVNSLTCPDHFNEINIGTDGLPKRHRQTNISFSGMGFIHIIVNNEPFFVSD